MSESGTSCLTTEPQPPPPKYIVERAKSSRSVCKECSLQIDKDCLRWGKRYSIQGKSGGNPHWAYAWRHADQMGCDHGMPIDPSGMSGWEQLSEVERARVLAPACTIRSSNSTEDELSNDDGGGDGTADQSGFLRSTEPQNDNTCQLCAACGLDLPSIPVIVYSSWKLQCPSDECRGTSVFFSANDEAVAFVCPTRLPCIRRGMALLSMRERSSPPDRVLERCIKCRSAGPLDQQFQIKQASGKATYNRILTKLDNKYFQRMK